MDDNVIFIDDFINKSDASFEKQINDKRQRAFVARQKMLELCARRLNEADMNAILGNTLDDEQLAKIANGLDVEIKDLKDIASMKAEMLGINFKNLNGDNEETYSGDEKSNGDDLGEDEHTKSESNDNGSSGGGASDSEEKKEDEKAKTEQVLEPEGEKKPNSIKEAGKKLKAALDSSQATVGVGILVAMGVVYLAVTNPALVGAVLLAKGVKDYRSGAKGK